MAYTTSYSLKSFNPTLSILYVSVDILDATLSVVESINSFPIKLPINNAGEVPVGTELTAHVEKVLGRVFNSATLLEKEYLYEQGSGVVVNAPAIYALTNDSETGESVTPTVVGYVFDQDGAPLAGATVTSSLTGSSTSDALGAFIFDATAGAQKITATHPAHITTFKMTTVVGLTHIVFTMQSAADVLTTVEMFNVDTTLQLVQGLARASNNAEIELPAGTIVDEFGIPVTTAFIDFANIVVSDPGVVDVFPGYFLGDPGTGQVPIQTYGFINLELRTAGGDPLYLDPAIGATIRLPVDPDPVGTDTIDTWKLNETTGIWEQTGTATRITGTNVFEFTVTSFSWHNLDQPLTNIDTLTVYAVDNPEYNPDIPNFSGIPAVGVEVTVNVDNTYSAYGNPSYTWQGRGVTDALGQLVLSVPQGYLRVTGKKGAKTYNGYSYESDGMGGASVIINYTLPWEDASTYITPVVPIYVLLTADPDYTTGGVATRSVMQVIDARQVSTFSGDYGIDNGNVVLSSGLSLVQTTGELEQAGPFSIINANDNTASLAITSWVTTTFSGVLWNGDPGFAGVHYYIEHDPITINGTATAVFSY